MYINDPTYKICLDLLQPLCCWMFNLCHPLPAGASLSWLGGPFEVTSLASAWRVKATCWALVMSIVAEWPMLPGLFSGHRWDRYVWEVRKKVSTILLPVLFQILYLQIHLWLLHSLQSCNYGADDEAISVLTPNSPLSSDWTRVPLCCSEFRWSSLEVRPKEFWDPHLSCKVLNEGHGEDVYKLVPMLFNFFSLLKKYLIFLIFKNVSVLSTKTWWLMSHCQF